MHPDQRLRKAVKIFYSYLGAVVLAGIGPAVGARLAERHETWARVAAVIVGVGAWIPIGIVVAWVIREGDEFTRRIHIVALAVSFAGSLVLVALIDWLARAEFIEQPPLMIVWLAMAVLWVFALFASKRRFERP